jgi:translocation and assembly module TamB
MIRTILSLVSPRPLFLVLAMAAVAAGAAVAQDGEDRSRFVRFLEGMLSTPERQVSFYGLSGTFSSSPRAERIVVSDAQGPWLEIEGVEVVWNRTALFRRVLDIDSLRAAQVRMLRKPAGGEQTETADFTGPPVDITIDSFALPSITLAPAVTGAEARLSAEGSAEVGEDAIGARVALTRTDRPGRLSAELRLQPATNELTADLQLAEPEGGLVAELLNLRGRPPVTVTIAGTGPLSAWQADVQVQAAENRVLTGQAAVSRVDGGYRISGDVVGTLGSLAPENYAALLSGDSRLAFNVVRRDDGGIAIDAASLRSAGVELDGTGALTPDMVPERADLSLRLGQAGRTALPFVPGNVSVGSLDVKIGLDAGAQAPWTANIRAAGVESAFGFVAETEITASGQASNLVDPAARASTFRMDGSATGVAPTDPKLAEAIGPTLRITSAGSWSVGQPVNLREFSGGADRRDCQLCGHCYGRGVGRPVWRQHHQSGAHCAARGSGDFGQRSAAGGRAGIHRRCL